MRSIVLAIFLASAPAAEAAAPDYDSRVEVMRTAGIDRGVFLTEVWGPVLKALSLTRHDLPRQRASNPSTQPVLSGAEGLGVTGLAAFLRGKWRATPNGAPDERGDADGRPG